jgi:hypothetical protein
MVYNIGDPLRLHLHLRIEIAKTLRTTIGFCRFCTYLVSLGIDTNNVRNAICGKDH